MLKIKNEQENISIFKYKITNLYNNKKYKV